MPARSGSRKPRAATKKARAAPRGAMPRGAMPRGTPAPEQEIFAPDDSTDTGERNAALKLLLATAWAGLPIERVERVESSGFRGWRAILRR